MISPPDTRQHGVETYMSTAYMASCLHLKVKLIAGDSLSSSGGEGSPVPQALKCMRGVGMLPQGKF